MRAFAACTLLQVTGDAAAVSCWGLTCEVILLVSSVVLSPLQAVSHHMHARASSFVDSSSAYSALAGDGMGWGHLCRRVTWVVTRW